MTITDISSGLSYKVFRYPLMIRETHLDTFGHVNNATYLALLEEARWEIIAPRGFGIATIQEKQVGPVILDFTVKFLKELKLRQNIVIESQIDSHNRKIAVLRQDIFNEKNEKCFESKLTIGLMDMKARKLIVQTPEWLHALGIVEEAAA